MSVIRGWGEPGLSMGEQMRRDGGDAVLFESGRAVLFFFSDSQGLGMTMGGDGDLSPFHHEAGLLLLFNEVPRWRVSVREDWSLMTQ